MFKYQGYIDEIPQPADEWEWDDTPDGYQLLADEDPLDAFSLRMLVNTLKNISIKYLIFGLLYLKLYAGILELESLGFILEKSEMGGVQKRQKCFDLRVAIRV